MHPIYNGNFLINNRNSENSALEADYAWVYFSFECQSVSERQRHLHSRNVQQLQSESGIQNGLDNKERGIFEKPVLIKQGFTNYQYLIVDKKRKNRL